MLPGVTFVDPGDTAALAAAVGPDTAAIILEPVLGEGGVHPLAPEFLQAAHAFADQHGAVLLFDEVQTGVGRTGTFFAWEQAGVKPDAVTLAKGLANGLPVGALLVGDDAPTGFVPGDHASTFGGNPVTCAAACAVLDEISDALLAGVRERSAQLTAGLNAMPAVVETRGLGLLLAAELDRPAADVIATCLRHGLLVGPATPTAIRITPSLTLTAAEADQALSILEEVLA